MPKKTTRSLRNRQRLSCGCIPGYFHCEEDTRLWNEVNRAYEAKDWDAYNAALTRYKQHRP